MVLTIKRVLSTIKGRHYSKEDIEILKFLLNFLRTELKRLNDEEIADEDLARELYYLLLDVQHHLTNTYN